MNQRRTPSLPAARDHLDVPYHQSAEYRFSKLQIVLMVGAIALIIAGLLLDWRTTAIIVIGGLTLMYAADMLFNLIVVTRSLKATPEILLTNRQAGRVRGGWPVYTILCPLYKEGRVLPQFIAAMKALDYPADKLQIMLLLEEDDRDTIDIAQNMHLPTMFEIIVVPHSLPKTKPKACNYGLRQALGEFVVIYDAEDIPDPKQLKKAVVAFHKSGDSLACIQSKLNFYNPYTNLLTRAFTSEYALWFNLVLPGLQAVQAPIPLGGTSNHFKTEILRDLGGWDAYNVTEDADLGIRIAKRGFRTAIIDSTTLEEANAHAKSWFWQRSRWVKGYYQTYFVHTRRGNKFGNSTFRRPHGLMFQLVIGGKVLSMLINPIMWLLTIAYIFFSAQLGPIVQQFYPAPILYMAVISLIFGNFLYMYFYMVGSARRGDYALIKYALLVPLYWLAMSAAAYYALYELIRRPHRWRKTAHGLNLQSESGV